MGEAVGASLTDPVNSKSRISKIILDRFEETRELLLRDTRSEHDSDGARDELFRVQVSKLSDFLVDRIKRPAIDGHEDMLLNDVREAHLFPNKLVSAKQRVQQDFFAAQERAPPP